MNSRLRILRVSFFLLIFFLSLFSAYSKSKRAAATDADAPETLTVAPAVNGKLKLSAAEKKLIKEQKKSGSCGTEKTQKAGKAIFGAYKSCRYARRRWRISSENDGKYGRQYKGSRKRYGGEFSVVFA